MASRCLATILVSSARSRELLPCVIRFIAVALLLIFTVASGELLGGGERDSLTELLASDVKAVSVGFPATHSGSDTRVFGQASPAPDSPNTAHRLDERLQLERRGWPGE